VEDFQLLDFRSGPFEMQPHRLGNVQESQTRKDAPEALGQPSRVSPPAQGPKVTVIIGPNGSGKITLLRVMASEIPPDAGTVTRAEGLRAVMFEQGRAGLDLSLTLKQALSPNSDTVMYRDRPMHVAAWAKQFLFTADQLDLTISALSGGEQARIRIAQLMVKPADLLMLDEPTNDLDIPALEVLEDSLEEFPGAIVIVSHDRDLLDRLCTEVIGLDGLGGSAMYGNVSQWLTAHERATAEVQKAEKKANAPKTVTSTPKSKKLSFREQQEFDQMEGLVLVAEELVIERQSAVEAASTAGHTVLMDACKALEDAQHAVEKLYARWQELEAKRGA